MLFRGIVQCSCTQALIIQVQPYNSTKIWAIVCTIKRTKRGCHSPNMVSCLTLLLSMILLWGSHPTSWSYYLGSPHDLLVIYFTWVWLKKRTGILKYSILVLKIMLCPSAFCVDISQTSLRIPISEGGETHLFRDIKIVRYRFLLCRALKSRYIFLHERQCPSGFNQLWKFEPAQIQLAPWVQEMTTWDTIFVLHPMGPFFSCIDNIETENQNFGRNLHIQYSTCITLFIEDSLSYQPYQDEDSFLNQQHDHPAPNKGRSLRSKIQQFTGKNLENQDQEPSVQTKRIISHVAKSDHGFLLKFYQLTPSWNYQLCDHYLLLQENTAHVVQHAD